VRIVASASCVAQTIYLGVQDWALILNASVATYAYDVICVVNERGTYRYATLMQRLLRGGDSKLHTFIG
jgi:hypothetical protein